MSLANDGNYRETRWFTAWTHKGVLHDFYLPQLIHQLTDQTTVPFGDAVLVSSDGIVIGVETCEELFTPQSPHISLFLNGVDIISNSSASHHEFKKLDKRIDLIKNATGKVRESALNKKVWRNLYVFKPSGM